MMERGKLFMEDLVEKVGFWGILGENSIFIYNSYNQFITSTKKLIIQPFYNISSVCVYSKSTLRFGRYNLWPFLGAVHNILWSNSNRKSCHKSSLANGVCDSCLQPRITRRVDVMLIYLSK